MNEVDNMNFDEANLIGKKGEAKVCQWLRDKGWLVCDLSLSDYFQKIDVDFIIYKVDENGNQSKPLMIDVKTDRYTTGNMAIETISNDNKMTDGCIYQTQADYWFYYYPNLNKLCIFKPSDMRALLKENEGKYKPFKMSTRGYGGGVLYSSHGYLVPVTELEKVRTVSI